MRKAAGRRIRRLKKIDLRWVQALMKYVRFLPTFSLVMTSPWFFVSEPPALSIARVVGFCQPIAVMISSSVVPPSRLSIAITWLVLLPSRGVPAFAAATGVFFVLVALFLRGSLLRRHVGRLWRNGRSHVGFRAFRNDGFP